MPLSRRTKRRRKSSGMKGLLFPPPKGASSVATTHSAQDSLRQLFLKLSLHGPFQKLASETGGRIINHLDSTYTIFSACSPRAIRRLLSPGVSNLQKETLMTLLEACMVPCIAYRRLHRKIMISNPRKSNASHHRRHSISLNSQEEIKF